MTKKGLFVDNEKARASDRLARDATRLARQRNAELAVTIKALINQRGLTSAAVALAVGVSPAAVARWCGGDDVPNSENLGRLAACLGVAPSFFLSYQPEVIGKFTKAVRPGVFMSETEDSVLREAEYSAAAERRAKRQLEEAQRAENRKVREERALAAALRFEEERTRKAVLKRLQLPGVQNNWRLRMEVAGDRCMFCVTPLAAPGICRACADERTIQ